MARLFGTDGIRGVANVDLKPTLAYALGRATAQRLVGKGGALLVGQDTRRSGDLFVAAITAGATSLGVDVHVVGVVPDAGPRPSHAVRAVRGRDHGLGLAQPGRRQRAQGPRRRRAQARRRGRGRARGAHLARGRAGRGRQRRAGSAGRRGGLDRRLHRASPRAWPPVIDACGRRIVLDGANGSGSARRPGHPRGDRAPRSRPSTSSRTASTSTCAAGRPIRPRWPRPSWPAVPTSGSRSTATPTGSSRSMPPARSSMATRSSGILALERLRPWRPARRARRVDPVERWAPGGRRGGGRRGRPHAGRRQVHPRRDAGVRRDARRREVRARHRPRAHDLGRRHGHRARGPARDGPARIVARRARRRDPAPAAATARRPRPSQGPVGG